MRKHNAIWMVALVLAGCGPTPATGGWVTAGPTRAASAADASTGATSRDAAGNVNRQSDQISLTVGHDAAIPVIVVDASAASAATGTRVSAASGGVVRSADG